MGYLSETFGQRLTIIGCIIGSGALIYPYSFTSSHRVIAAAFFLQFFIEGILGVVPVHMLSLSPGTLRTSTVGTAYQLGNLASSASATIETTLGERFPLTSTKSGLKRYNYGKVICIFTACGLLYMLFLALIAPEGRRVPLDVGHDKDVAEAMHRDLKEIDEIAHNGKRDEEY